MTAVADVEQALSEGRDLKAWWVGVESGLNTVERFELAPAFAGGDAVVGFFGEAQTGGKTVAVMGYVADYFFDLACMSLAEPCQTAEWMASQAEEFALTYWLRTEAWALPQPYPRLDQLEPPPLLKALSLSPPANPELAGLANVQRAYKLRGTGQTGEFPASDARAIIDLRALESLYEWITVERLPLDFSLTWAVGDSGLSLTLPLPIAGHLALSSDLTVRQRHPSPGVIGEFGAGLAPMNVPGRIAIGPASSQPGLRLQTLRVLDTAEVRLRTVTIMPRCSGLLKFFLEPVAWGRDAADWMTLGMSARFLSEAGPGQVERYLLSAHAIKLRDALLGTRAAWQQVRDWLDPAGIPEWIEKGKVT